ncbi:hypothetical protein IWX47DRAFT_944550, partial [Phyllosticta citricarpa]
RILPASYVSIVFIAIHPRPPISSTILVHLVAPSSMATSSPVFEKSSIVAQANGTDGRWCPCGLRIYNQQDTQGMISLRIRASFEEHDVCQWIYLQHSPRDLVTMDVSTDAQVPIAIQNLLDDSVPRPQRGKFLVLSLTLANAGRLLVPQVESPCLTPKPEHHEQVGAFQEVCRATKLRLYIQMHGLNEYHHARLENFRALAVDGKLDCLSSFRRRLYSAGIGTREITPQHTKRRRRKQIANAEALAGSPRGAPKPPLKRSHCHKDEGRAYVPNTDSETDYSALALSPVGCYESGTAAADADAPPLYRDSRDQGVVNKDEMKEALREMLKGTLKEILPGMLRQTLREILPRLLQKESKPDGVLCGALRPLFTDIFDQYIDENEPLGGICGLAEDRLREVADDVMCDIRQATEEGLQQVADAEQDARERLDEYFGPTDPSPPRSEPAKHEPQGAPSRSTSSASTTQSPPLLSPAMPKRRFWPARAWSPSAAGSTTECDTETDASEAPTQEVGPNRLAAAAEHVRLINGHGWRERRGASV